MWLTEEDVFGQRRLCFLALDEAGLSLSPVAMFFGKEGVDSGFVLLLAGIFLLGAGTSQCGRNEIPLLAFLDPSMDVTEEESAELTFLRLAFGGSVSTEDCAGA